MSNVMKTETISLNLLALRDEALPVQPTNATFDGSSTVSHLSLEAAEEIRRSSPVRLVLPKAADGISPGWLLRILTCG